MKKKITSFQISILIFFLCLGLYEGIANVILYSSTKQNAWLVILLSIIFSFIPIALIISIINFEPNKNIIKKVEILLGKHLGNIINFILSVCIFMILILTCWNLFSFINIEYLNKTPQLFIGILFIGTSFYAIMKGIDVILKSGEIILYISLLLITIIILSLFGLPNFNNLKPFFSNSFNTFLFESIHLLSYTIIPTFVITIIPKNEINDNQKLTKLIVKSYIISQLFIFLVTFITITVLGPELATIYQFPTYYTVRKINVVGVIENTENFFSVLWIFSMYFIITMCLYYINTYVKEIFKIKTKKKEFFLLLLICLFTLYYSDKIFPSTINSINFMKKSYNYFIALIIFIIMVLLGIIIFQKGKKTSNNNAIQYSNNN
ncbi:MAG: endospore germination permease [Mollicutes bacterium]|nr:endospore germination permease [Mollicutes bacterium]